jgi:hypothetical protein
MENRVRLNSIFFKFALKRAKVILYLICLILAFFILSVYFFGGLECVGHSFANVAYFVFLGDVWIRTQRAAVASRCAANLATHLLILATHLPI